MPTPHCNFNPLSLSLSLTSLSDTLKTAILLRVEILFYCSQFYRRLEKEKKLNSDLREFICQNLLQVIVIMNFLYAHIHPILCSKVSPGFKWIYIAKLHYLCFVNFSFTMQIQSNSKDIVSNFVQFLNTLLYFDMTWCFNLVKL